MTTILWFYDLIDYTSGGMTYSPYMGRFRVQLFLSCLIYPIVYWKAAALRWNSL